MDKDNVAPVHFYQSRDYHNKSNEVAVPAGLRRVVLTWKTAGKKAPKERIGVKVPSVYFEIPQAKVTVQPAELQNALLAAYEGYEDSCIRQLVLAKFNWKTKEHGKIEISSDEISVAKVAEHAAAKGLGRLNAAAISAWFDDVAILPLSETIAAKKGKAPTDDAVVESIAVFKAHFEGLASTKLQISIKVAEAMLRAIAAIEASFEDDEEDAMLDKLSAIVAPFAKPDESVADMI